MRISAKSSCSISATSMRSSSTPGSWGRYTRPSGVTLRRRRPAGVVGDERLGLRDLVDDDVVVAPLDRVLELGGLVAWPDDEPVVLRAHALVDVQRDADAAAAPAVLAALAHEVDGAVGRIRLRTLTQLR